MDNKSRFSGISECYSRFRPGYPRELINVLTEKFGMGKESVVADIGSGTGKLSEIFLENSNIVYCVEPNNDMRMKAKKDLSHFASATIINGSAENTTLPDHSIDFITAGQSFHWFDPELSKKEFLRILKPKGVVTLIWNDRVQSSQGINKEYEEICKKYSRDYHRSGSLAIDYEIIVNFLGPDYELFGLKNIQRMDLESLKGRYFSASYSIKPDDENYEKLLSDLETAFRNNEKDGLVCLEYETKVYVSSTFS